MPHSLSVSALPLPLQTCPLHRARLPQRVVDTILPIQMAFRTLPGRNAVPRGGFPPARLPLQLLLPTPMTFGRMKFQASETTSSQASTADLARTPALLAAATADRWSWVPLLLRQHQCRPMTTPFNLSYPGSEEELRQVHQSSSQTVTKTHKPFADGLIESADRSCGLSIMCPRTKLP